MAKLRWFGGQVEEPPANEPQDPLLPEGYDPYWSIAGDGQAATFILELSDQERGNQAVFLNKCVDFGFTADQAMELWFSEHRLERGIANGMVGHPRNQQLFGFLMSEKGMEWLTKDNSRNLRLFFFSMLRGFGSR